MIVRKVVSCSLSICFLYLLSVMDDSDLVYFDVDAATITAASLTLGKDKGGLVESLSNHASYEGRRLRTNVHAPGALRRGEACVFYRGMLRAPEWVTRTVKEGYIPFDQEAPPRVDLEKQPFQPEGF